ncbi:MAG: Ig-like domain-containing protein [Rhodosalinus sp.]
MRRAAELFAALLCLLAVAAGHSLAQERETLTIPLPERTPQQAAPPDESRILREVQWSLNAEGRWNRAFEGRGEARVTQGLVRVTMPLEGEDQPLRFHVAAEDEAITHVAFSQLDDTLSGNAGLLSSGTNFLESTGRQPVSIGAGRSAGYLANHEGFVRVDRRDGDLIVRFSLTAVNCVDITSPPFLSQPPCDGGDFINARPDGMSQVEGCITAVETLRATPDACDLPFQVDHVSPRDTRENVAHDDPGIHVTFSDPIRLNTLGPAFTLYTLDPEGEELPVDGDWQQAGASRYRFVPRERLFSGTIYLARVEGGANGVLSRDGAVLEEDYTWSFTTLLDLAAQAPEDRDPVLLHNFQVVRDGELTRDKPTLTRAYFTWEKHPEVAEDMQPDSFRMVIETSVTYPRRIAQTGAQAGRAMRIWRHDDDEIFTDEDRRQARHTANFFGWRPSGRDGTLEWTVKPEKPFPAPVAEAEYHASHDYSVWDTDPPDLRIHYTFAQVGAWRDGVPDAVRSFAGRAMQGTAREIPSFFPHRTARANFRPTLPAITETTVENLLYDEEGHPVDGQGNRLDMSDCYDATRSAPTVFEDLVGDLIGMDPRCWLDHVAADAQDYLDWDPAPEDLCDIAHQVMPIPPASDLPKDRSDYQSEALLRYLSPRMNAWYQIFDQAEQLDAILPPSDIIAIFAPSDFLGEGTGGYAQGMAFYTSVASLTAERPAVLGFPHMRVYTIAIPPDYAVMDEFIQINLHEIGHEFGLEHVPGNARLPDACPQNGSVLASELAGRNIDGIEAWRMTVDGLDGWNKSQEEGNAQADDGTLVSMMWPWAMSTNLMSLQHGEYVRLQRSIAEGPASIWRESSIFPPSNRMPALPVQPRYAQSAAIRNDGANVEEMLVVTGRLSDTGLQIRGIDRMVEDWPPPPPGRYHAELLDAQGRLVARAPLGLRAPIDPVGDRAPDDRMGWDRFRVSLPLDASADRLVIREGERIRARLPMPSQQPRVVGPEITALDDGYLQLDWDVDGPVAWTEISYSADGQAPWQVLAPYVSDRTVRLRVEDLQPGSRPVVRITARLGLRFSDAHVMLPATLRQQSAD